MFGRKEYGTSTRVFSDEGSVMLGRKEYCTFGTKSLYTRNRFCEEFSGCFSVPGCSTQRPDSVEVSEDPFKVSSSVPGCSVLLRAPHTHRLGEG